MVLHFPAMTTDAAAMPAVAKCSRAGIVDNIHACFCIHALIKVQHCQQQHELALVQRHEIALVGIRLQLKEVPCLFAEEKTHAADSLTHVTPAVSDWLDHKWRASTRRRLAPSTSPSAAWGMSSVPLPQSSPMCLTATPSLHIFCR